MSAAVDGGAAVPVAAGPPPARTRFERPSEEVAPELLGLLLVAGDAVLRIVEVEAYAEHDAASHSAMGPRPRTAVMFGPAGHLYVYRSYGLHWCANVVCGPAGDGAAVLLRAGAPCAGLAAMWPRRPRATRERDLASGPGKLCAALGITGAHDGSDVLDPGGALRLAVPAPHGPDPGGGAPAPWMPAPADVVQTTRIGITRDVERPWRWLERANPHVSRPPARAGVPAGPARRGAHR